MKDFSPLILTNWLKSKFIIRGIELACEGSVRKTEGGIRLQGTFTETSAGVSSHQSAFGSRKEHRAFAVR